MPTTEFDYLIIGQGLAGSILAHTLITRGLRVMVIDNHHTGSSSQVAAGLINPITGPRLSNGEGFAEYYNVAKQYYAKLQYHIKAPVFSQIKQTRQLNSQTQEDYLDKRLINPQYHGLITKPKGIEKSHFKPSVFTNINIHGTATVDTKTLLRATQSWLAGLYCYQATKLNYADLTFSEQGVRYQNIQAGRIIFCEGYQAINNPWLKKLPFKLAKGEILTITAPDLDSTMLSWEKWLVPDSSAVQTAKLGSNFNWDSLDLTPSSGIKEMLLNSLRQSTTLSNISVRKHEVGIRPSTRQREPFIGALTQLNNAYCFNGFGSKGCLLIPFYAQLLADHLIHQATLPNKVTQWL